MKTSIKRSFCLLIVLALSSQLAHPFCGFYVAKADADLFNESSQVILARDGDRTVVTMANDFQGDVKDFAIVVPVPVVLQEDQIRIAEQSIFDKLDAYTGPRLVEYHDHNPCQRYLHENRRHRDMTAGAVPDAPSADVPEEDELGVTVEATYTVGEYDIKILSAEYSDGLETWLTHNGYQLPPQARQVLKPYIRSNMKFFVVKVNLDAYEAEGAVQLRPIQIEYNSDKFMLPIRLGMANSRGFQDLIVYAFSRIGRIETVNYPTRELPTNINIPVSVQNRYGAFYKALFSRAWERADKRSVMLEYFWDISSDNYTKCDPCPTSPPALAELQQAGVFWVKPRTDNNRWSGSDYTGEVYITRLHARYSRSLYPEDFLFQETPNKSNYQARYVMHHKANGPMDCDAGKEYLEKRKEREKQFAINLAYLTGWNDGTPPDDPSKIGDDGLLPFGSTPDFFNPGGYSLLQLLLSFGLLALLGGLVVRSILRRRRAAAAA